MTEGNIATWKVKEGDSFAAGDILLEIETDKASMDVEAQDDGIVAKIIQGDGSKGIKVGTRIGVLAEPEDDLSTLEIPAEEAPAKPAAKEETKATPEPAPSTPSQPPPSNKPSKLAKKQTYPLLPSVQHLLHEHGLDASAVDKMTPTGPNNRLLKGDVLAYIGSISSSYPSELSARIAKLGKLDLSNIKLAPPPPAPKVTKTAEPVPEPIIEDLEVAVSISMKAVVEVQKRVESTLGVFVPLSTFISRATDVGNDNLPRPKSYKPTADELFSQILGLENVASPKGYTGSFLPQITVLPGHAPASKPSSRAADIIDILAGNKSATQNVGKSAGISATVNVFSVKVPKGDEKTAEVFLERVKDVLEREPGRLVL